MAEARATIRRGAAARPRAAAPAKRARPAAKRPGLFARLPVRPETVQRLVTWLVLALGAAIAALILWATGVPAMAGQAMADMTARAGFEVKRVELKGVRNMDRLTVYAIAFDQHSMAMPAVDLEQVRQQLLKYGWIADARVSRRLPDTLVVDVVERVPAAVWQYRGRLKLIDAGGVVLEDVTADAMPDLPLLIGPNANLHAGELAALLAKTPALKPVIAGASWIGERRWDLRFQSGETLALPEGEEEAQRALVRFARLDTNQRLLGRGFVRFDMRDPRKFVARVGKQVRAIDGSIIDDSGSSEEQGAAPAAPAPAPARATGGLERVSETL
jgi:cell division protein FtsQ